MLFPSKILKSNECSEYSCVGVESFFVFFSGKSFEKFTLSFDFLQFDFFVDIIYLFKGKANSLIELQNVKISKNVIDF